MVRFFEIQRNHFTRRDLIGRFGLAVGYHVNASYLLLWGMLEQLTTIAKQMRGLALNERDCGIQKKQFWKKLREPGLQAFVQQGRIGEWVNLMADVRHQAAHSTIPIPGEVFMDTEDSKKSDEEIRRIIQKERPLFYQLALVTGMESQMIQIWRVKHMKRLAPSMVVMRNRQGSGGYMRDPVIIEFCISKGNG